MNKPEILIDSLYINRGGGLHLLEYLVAALQKKDISFFLLLDCRCQNRFESVKQKLVVKASLFNRKHFYIQHSDSFSSVFCFGNIPPQLKLNVPTYTYFHNINLLTLQESNGYVEYIKQYLKRCVFKYYKDNTDYWLVQTPNTANELVKNLNEKEEKVLLFPFYDLPIKLRALSTIQERADYAFVGDYYNGAKGHNELLDAWEILYKNGINLTLHLTVDKVHTVVNDRINKLISSGVHIINHGIISFDNVIEIYSRSKAIVYPSHNESLGLGVIEAITAGCDVVGADLPYIHSVCKPSIVFKPYSGESIASAVQTYEKGCSVKTELLINNRIDELIELISSCR